MNFKTFAISLAAISSLGLAATTVAQAQSRESFETHVSTARINFQNKDEVKALYMRLAYAAKDVCDSDAVDPKTQIADRACETQSLADAVAAVHNDNLIQYASSLQTSHRLMLVDGFSLAMNTPKN